MPAGYFFFSLFQPQLEMFSPDGDITKVNVEKYVGQYLSEPEKEAKKIGIMLRLFFACFVFISIDEFEVQCLNKNKLQTRCLFSLLIITSAGLLNNSGI